MPTRQEQRIIRAYYSAQYYALKFSDGCLFAKQRRDSPWGVLYTREMLARHLATIRNSWL